MKAIICEQYGSPDVLQFTDVPKPTPRDDEILVKVHTASVNPLDWRFLRGKPFFLRFGGLFKPKHKILGVDIAGRIESVGKSVKQFKPGDEVFGGAKALGGFAEYVCTREDHVVFKPPNLSFDAAAAIPVAAITALMGLRDNGKIQRGQRVLVDGSSGGVGTFAVQLAKSFGAEITAVCSPSKMETARSLGADYLIDYTQQDFTKSGQRYDLIFAANAYHSIFDYRRSLSPKGIYVMAGGGGAQILQALFLGPLLSMFGSKKMSFVMAKIGAQDLTYLKNLIEAGELAPVIERRYPLSEVAEALRYLEAGHSSGKVVINIAKADAT